MKTDNKQTRKEPIAANIPAKLEGRSRVVIEAVEPEIDNGEYPIQRVVGETVVVEADIFADGHDVVMAHLLYRGPRDRSWQIAPMGPLVNDRWRGQFPVSALGEHRYTLEGWIDPFATWRNAMKKRIDAAQDVHVELLSGGNSSTGPAAAGACT
ncbi:MAG: maltotransferase domain-containing protein [Acidobacteriaceae bacterium]